MATADRIAAKMRDGIEAYLGIDDPGLLGGQSNAAEFASGPEIMAVARKFAELGVEDLRFAGAGMEKVVFNTLDGNVLRIHNVPNDDPPRRRALPGDWLRGEPKGSAGICTIDSVPFADPPLPFDHAFMSSRLKRHGFVPLDPKPSNFGRLSNGRIVVFDGNFTDIRDQWIYAEPFKVFEIVRGEKSMGVVAERRDQETAQWLSWDATRSSWHSAPGMQKFFSNSEWKQDAVLRDPDFCVPSERLIDLPLRTLDEVREQWQFDDPTDADFAAARSVSTAIETPGLRR